MTSTTPNLSDPIVTIEPVLVDCRTAANILAISESTLRNTIRQYNLTPRYVGTKPLLVTELRTYAQTLPEHPTHH